MNLIPDNIEGYALAKSSLPGETCQALAAHTRKREPMAQMLAGELVASFLGLLVRTCGVKSILEIGTYTGYTALAMAESLPPEGTLVTLDKAPKESAATFWGRSAHGKKIRQVTGEALDTLTGLTGPFDMVFIDADKANYPRYLKEALARLSPRGFIVADNCLWSGRVLEEGGDEDTMAIKAFNDQVAADAKLYSTLLPLRDGLMLIKKI